MQADQSESALGILMELLEKLSLFPLVSLALKRILDAILITSGKNKARLKNTELRDARNTVPMT